MLNYLLIAVTALVKRAKNIATRRCYGAPTWAIYKMLISEALLTLLLSLALAAFLIFALQEPVVEIVGVEYRALFGVVAGGAASLFAAGKLLEMFAYKIALSWWIFTASAIAVTAVIAAVVILTTRKAADANPVENLKG